MSEKGEYTKGDRPTVDMDFNGWPSAKRDRAVEIMRKGFAFHIAGDQHLGSFIKYGVDDHGDSGYAFAGPALNNIWPRRFWPNINSDSHTYEKPAYTGEHEDGFGNKMTVLAVANSHKAHKEPEILHKRAVGYGIVTFNKKTREIVTECWPRFVDPLKEKNGQYPGWPITISQEDNYLQRTLYYLPEVQIIGNGKAVVKVFHDTGVLVYALRIKEARFTPKVFKQGYYNIHVSLPESNFEKRIEKVKAKTRPQKTISVTIS